MSGRLLLLVAVLLYVAMGRVVLAHSRFKCPPPRSSNPGLKSDPCGGVGGPNSDPVTVLSPGWQTISWEETICHNGAPWRIALSKVNSDSSNSDFNCILLNHIPHDDAGCPPSNGLHLYQISIYIPDVFCDNCVLQLVNPMTDKVSGNCYYPTGSGSPVCTSVYHSCANVKIDGTNDRNTFTCSQPPTWAFGSLPATVYDDEPTTGWSNGWLSPSASGDIVFSTPAGLCGNSTTVPDDSADEDEIVGNYCSDDKSFCLSWSMTDGKTIEFLAEGKTAGWVGFGLAKPGQTMLGADIMAGWMYGGGVVLSDRHATAYAEPQTDEPQNLAPLAVVVADGKTTIHFSRLLDTGDDSGDNVIDLNAPTTVIWAMGGTNPGGSAYTATMTKHSETGSVKITFGTGKATSTNVELMRIFHGLLMFLGWAVLLPTSIYTARYRKEELGGWWFRLHVGLNVLAMVLIVSAFAIIYSVTAIQNFNALHAALGVFVFSCLFVQAALGLASHLMYVPGRRTTPRWPDRVHHYFGRFIIVCACVNMLFGLSRLDGPIAYHPLLLLYFIALIAGFIYRERSRRGSGSDEPAGPFGQENLNDGL